MSDFEEIDLNEIEQKMKELQAAQEQTLSQEQAVRKQLSELQQQFQLATNLRFKLEKEAQTQRQELRETEKALEKARRLASVKEDQKRLQEEFLSKAKELDELTAQSKWREFAYDHQIEGGKRLAVAKRGILGDKRGLGKTLTSLVWLDMVQAKKILIVAPNDVVSQFEEEIRAWAPGRTIFPLSGMAKSQRTLIYPMIHAIDEYILTINYEAWRRDKTIIDDLVTYGIDTIICDEAHRIKSSDKVTARGVFQVTYRPNFCPNCETVANFCGSWFDKDKAKLVDKVAGYSNYSSIGYHELPVCPNCETTLQATVANVLNMTGTPILNKPQELFSLLYMVDKVQFPKESKFLDDYCYSSNGKWYFLRGGLKRLTAFMSEFFLQRTREDAGITIPPPAITIHTLEKDFAKYPLQYGAEKTITEKAQLLLQDGTRKDIFFILELILRERQCMTWPAGIVITDPETKEVLCNFDVEESQKVDAATEFLEELCEEEERVVIFSQLKAPLYEMYDRITKKGYSAVMATGDQSKYQKEQVREDFDLKNVQMDKTPRWQVCFATYKAFGTGINLNAARQMILLDEEWNPGMEDQAIGRIDRMNSTDQANVHIFRVKNSVDDFMAALLEEKRGLTEGFNTEAKAADQLKKFFE